MKLRRAGRRVLWTEIAALAMLIGAGCTGTLDEPAGTGPDGSDPPSTEPPDEPPRAMVDPDPNELDQRTLFTCSDESLARTAPRVVRLTPGEFGRRWPVSLRRATPITSDPSFRYSTDARDSMVDADTAAFLIDLALEAGKELAARRSDAPRCLRLDRETDTACLSDWASNYLRKVLARPATDAETDALVTYAQASVATYGFADGLALAYARPYLSPAFLYRAELGAGEPDPAGRTMLGSFELANAIAFVFTNGTVDMDPEQGLTEAMAALRRAAEADELRTREQVEAHVRALFEAAPEGVEHPALATNVLRFFREYLGYGEVELVFKSGGIPSGMHWYIPREFPAQLDAMVSRLAREDEAVLDRMLTSRTFFFPTKDVTTSRAQDGTWPFNMEGPDVPQGWIEMPEDQRAGLLTHPGWLAAHSSNQHTDPHPVHRGKWIRENLLCDRVDDVPVGVDAQLVEAEDLGVRARLEATTTANGYCWSCHQRMDPLGIPFEAYNHYGRHRTEEILGNGELAPVDARSVLVDIDDPVLDGATVTDAVHMMRLFAESERVEMCFLRQTFRFFVRRPETYADACTLSRMLEVHRESGGSFLEVLVALLTSDSFLYRGEEPETGEER